MKIKFVDTSVFNKYFVKLVLKPFYGGIKVFFVTDLLTSGDLMTKLKVTAGVMVVSFGQGACEIIKDYITSKGDNVGE